MPLLVYRPHLFENTAENLQFRCLCEELKRRISIADKHNKPELCLFVGNFNFAEKEFDAFMIKRNGIILIEFKNFGGKISISNNEWKIVSEGKTTGIIKGGSGGKTPLEQARLNRNAFIRNMVDSMTLTQSQAQKIASLVVFNHNAEIENNLRLNVQTWLNVCDNRSFFGTIESIVNKDFDFSALEMKRIAERLVLDDDYIIEEYSNTEFLDTWNTPHLLEKYNQLLNGEIIFSPEPDPFVEENENPNWEETSSSSEISAEEKPASTPSTIPQVISLYIQQIMASGLPGATYSILDCEETSPSVDFDICEKYLITIDIEPNEKRIESLSKFIRRPVYADNGHLYWTFGERITTIRPSTQAAIGTDNRGPRRSSTQLPPWLDSFIFNQLGALYDPRYRRFEFNDDLNEEEVKIYLGTYFPRSYAESFLIFDNILSNEKYRLLVSARSELTIFSIGSGTGGDIIGLLASIDKYIPQNIPVSILSLDVNTYALSVQMHIIERYERITDRRIRISQFKERIQGPDTLKKYADNSGMVDFLLFSKIGCELHAKNILKDSNIYTELLTAFKGKISPVGMTALIDVTTKADGIEHMPIILNRGVASFIKANPEYATLLPLSCNKYENKCTIPCFIQQEIHVSHCKKLKDLSKICYRIVAHSDLCKKIVNTDNTKYIITPSKLSENNVDAFCIYSLDKPKNTDAFNLK